MAGHNKLGEGMRKLILILVLIGFILPIQSKAEDCKAWMEGYCLSKIAEQTVKALPQKIEISLPQDQEENELIVGNDYLSFYNNLWDKLITNNLATAKEKTKAYDMAAKSGGTKIGGVNLVILAAQTLEQLSNKKIISMRKAQEVLDHAKIK